MSSAMFTNAGQLREKGTGLGKYRMSFLRRQSSASFFQKMMQPFPEWLEPDVTRLPTNVAESDPRGGEPRNAMHIEETLGRMRKTKAYKGNAWIGLFDAWTK